MTEHFFIHFCILMGIWFVSLFTWIFCVRPFNTERGIKQSKVYFGTHGFIEDYIRAINCLKRKKNESKPIGVRMHGYLLLIEFLYLVSFMISMWIFKK